MQNLHLCTQKSVCARNFGLLGEIRVNFSLQLSSRTQFAKINNKKVTAENLCEKHKKSSLIKKFWPKKPTDMNLQRKHTVKPLYNGHSKIDKTKILMTNCSLMKVKSIAECSPWSILQYFWPALSNNWS